MDEIVKGRNEPAGIEVPVPSTGTGRWGSDVAADVIRSLDIPFVALNPGASYRGLHDSLVNHLGNRAPQMLLCLHEEHAIGIAHGWAKVTGRAMMAIVHSNVGLMHATMALFNAWCDRMPLLLYGATGPMDAAKRRPWIDWIHTSKDMGALIRHYTKWDDQPNSVAAMPEAILRGRQIAETAPRGPTYVCFDVGLQEQKVENPPTLPDVSRYKPPAPAAPPPDLIADIAKLLHAAERPLILMGRVSRDESAWGERVKLAESLGAVVLTDLKLGGAFPTEHPLHGAPAGSRLTPPGVEALKNADVVLSLEARDLGGVLQAAHKGAPITSKIIRVAVDQHLHNGWSMDYLQLAPVDHYILAEPEPTVTALKSRTRKIGSSENGGMARAYAAQAKSPALAGRQRSHHSSSCRCRTTSRNCQSEKQSYASTAVLGRISLANSRSPRLSWRRRGWWRGWRSRSVHWSRTRLERDRTVAHFGLRGWRLPDGRNCDLDRSTLRDTDPVRDR